MKKSTYRYIAILMAGIFSASISFATEDQSSGDSGSSSTGFVDTIKGMGRSAGEALGIVDPVKKASEEKEAKSPGLEAEKQKILYNVESMQKYVELGNIVDPGMVKIKKGGQQYFDHQSDCVSRQNTAAKWCLETLSPNVTDIVTALNTMMSTVGGSSVNNSCSTFAKAMDLAKAGMTAYTAACGTTKAGCGYACVKARKGVEMVQEGLKSAVSCKVPTSPSCGADLAAYQALQQQALQGVTAELEKGNNSSVAGKADLCTGKYAQLAVSAIAGITSIANSLNQGKACDDATSASNVAQTLEQKCAVEANAKLPECICLKNPMLEGCGSTAVKATMSADGFSSVSSAGDKTLGTASGLKSSDLAIDGAGIDSSGGKNTASAGGAPSPVAGGGGAGLGGGGGGSGSGRDPADDKSGQKALNANILGGGSGGGGGGWGSRGGGDDSGKGYRSYLPGGDKDPNKMAGQQSWTKEVTGQGGKSNWEKVKDRYRDNKSTLLSN